MMAPMRKKALSAAVVGGAAAIGLGAWWMTHRVGPQVEVSAGGQSQANPARFVGGPACARCHPKEEARWRGSHHQLAMQVADATTVLGDFGSRRFTSHGVTSTFYRKNDRFLVRTDGPDGALHDYEIAYTFGVYPLQQYLIAFPGGRYQALTICWDARPLKEGGQRWFHLHPEEEILHGDILHWTGPYQNWNFMCAECHSTNVRKGYQLATDTYQTTWSEINVSCEACHGPGSAHLDWGEAVRSGRVKKDDPRNGLVVRLKEPVPATWEFDLARGIARRSRPRTSHTELETCARCHSRRSVVSAEYAYGRPLLDTHRPALLEEALYHADGQIKDEVYEYGSFLQSKMFHEGVTCSDCHDPHRLKIPSPDAVCARCHREETFNTPSHHFHRPASAGASCVACHMPSRKYMVVDPRRDHSFRVPRPDLSLSIGTPNACNDCHQDRSSAWAAEAAARWWPRGAPRPLHYGEALHAGRAGLPGAERLLRGLAGDVGQPGIARATSVGLLEGYPGAAPEAVERALRDPDPLVRMAALGPADGLPPDVRLSTVAPLLTDPLRTVRIDAARALASVPREPMSPEQGKAFEAALAEYRAAQLANVDRAEAHLNLGALDLDRGELARAEQEYLTALRLNPRFPPTYANLADLYRRQGRDLEGERVLRKGLAAAPSDPGLHQALGLWFVRRKRLPEALVFLARSAELGPDQPNFGYVYAVALQSAGQVDHALEVLRKTHRAHPRDAEVLLALVTMSRDRGSIPEAIGYAKELAALSPQDPRPRRLLAQLQAERR
jgi:Flp pilus assembly protein TadD